MRHDQTTRPMSKSPMAVARIALQVGQQALPAYSSKYSPQRYTQAQLLACLVLTQFFKIDYRGICALLSDFSDLRDVLGLDRVPHYTTLWYAHQRLLRQLRFRALPQQVWQWASAHLPLPARLTGI